MARGKVDCIGLASTAAPATTPREPFKVTCYHGIVFILKVVVLKVFKSFGIKSCFSVRFVKVFLRGKNVILRTFPKFRSTQRRVCGLSRRLRKLSATAAQSCIVL